MNFSIPPVQLSVSLFVFALLVAICASFTKDDSMDSMEEVFRNPPAAFKPRTWMHVMSGNMSAEGLTKDLKAIHEAGIGGVVLFNIAQGIPNGPVVYNSDRHHELIAHAAAECERLGLSFGVHNCDGWSSSGGPWISPEQSMKMVVWSDTLIQGGEKLQLRLPQPSIREGFYKDIAVLAYPSLKSELEDQQDKPVLASSDPSLNLDVISDGRIDLASSLVQMDDERPWVSFSYARPHAIRSAYILLKDRHAEANLETSDDGVNYSKVRNLQKYRTGKNEWVIVESFEAISSRYFRISMNQSAEIKEMMLQGTQSMQNYPGRSSMAKTDHNSLLPIGNPDKSMVIPMQDILDLSSGLESEGVLRTDLPDGNWTILRFGYTSTGAFNHPASEQGRGLECDKFSRDALDTHYNAFVRRVIEESKETAAHALQYVQIDSYEMGGQNWTSGFEDIFREYKAYDILPYLPLFTGRFVESAESSEAVLTDLRETHCMLMKDNYFGYFTELCHKDGVLSYIEPYGFGPLNDLDVGGRADMVMGEFWMNRPFTMLSSAVSAGHIYGKSVISAESFTSRPEINWKGHPGMVKAWGDRAWSRGVTEFMFHRFTHQANTHVKPGLTMNRWGFHFDRTQTWWENAGPEWFKYIARGSFLLRQGVPVSDVLVFIGDGSPLATTPREDFPISLPPGINFDYVNAEVLADRISVDKKQMVLPEGTRYRILVLGKTRTMKLETLRRIYELASEGVPVAGFHEYQPAGLLELGMKEEYSRLHEQIKELPNVCESIDWLKMLERTGLKADLLIEGRDDIDFVHRKAGDVDIYFFSNPDSLARTFDCSFRVKEKIPERWDALTGDITKLGSFENENGITRTRIHLEAGESAFMVFRESSRLLEKAGLNKGCKPKLEYTINENERLILCVEKGGLYETTLVGGKVIKTAVDNLPDPIPIEGSWEVEFEDIDNPELRHQTFLQLSDWSRHELEEIRFYSGQASYRTFLDISENLLDEGLQTCIELGRVKVIAELKLNGQDAGICWMPPFQADITDYLQPGKNELEIIVTNQWSNKLIGDERFPKQHGGFILEGNFPQGKMPHWYVNNEPLPEGPRTTFCSGGFYKADDPLQPSGLLGPVRLTFKRQVIIN